MAAVEADRSDPNVDNNSDSEATTVQTPAIWVDDVVVDEGSSQAVFAVSRAAVSVVNMLPVTVDYETGPVSAASGEDFTSVRGSLTFFTGDVILTVRVPILNDVRHEGPESFLLILTRSTSAGIADDRGEATILDDDPAPSLSIEDISVAEGHKGTTSVTMTASLSASSGLTTTASFATADGSATASRDFTATGGLLSWAPGELTKTITVLVKGDNGREPDESFFVNLSSVSNAQLADGQGMVTIINDDGRVLGT